MVNLLHCKFNLEQEVDRVTIKLTEDVFCHSVEQFRRALILVQRPHWVLGVWHAVWKQLPQLLHRCTLLNCQGKMTSGDLHTSHTNPRPWQSYNSTHFPVFQSTITVIVTTSIHTFLVIYLVICASSGHCCTFFNKRKVLAHETCWVRQFEKKTLQLDCTLYFSLQLFLCDK